MANDFIDLNALTIENKKPKQDRIRQFIADIKNPYMVKVGDTLVRVEFAGGKNFSEALTTALLFHNISCWISDSGMIKYIL